MIDYTHIIEGLLFIKGDEGTSVAEVAYCLEVSENDAQAYIEIVKEKYESNDFGLEVNKLGDKYRFLTKKEYASYYGRILENPITQKLSNAALETLAIIAYKQPITRAQVSEIRGVNCEGIMKNLQARNLIVEAGVLETVGKPIIYNTTTEFLDLFNLSSIEELPSIDDFSIEEEFEHNLFELRYQEENNESS